MKHVSTAQDTGRERYQRRLFHHSNHRKSFTMALQIQKDSQGTTSEGNNAKEPPNAVDLQALIEGLNRDLAGEYQVILMYTHYSAKLTGPYRRELVLSSKPRLATSKATAVPGRQDRRLGGRANGPSPLPFTAKGPQEMLENALAAEKHAISDYNERSIRRMPSERSVSRGAWRIRSPTRPGTKRRSNASLSAGTNRALTAQSGAIVQHAGDQCGSERLTLQVCGSEKDPGMI